MNDEDRRAFCIENAVVASCGKAYDENGNLTTDFNKIIDAAKAFEAYLKGTNNE